LKDVIIYLYRGESYLKKISLIALDIGGTLLADNNTITEENITTIHNAKCKGILIALATAREYSSTKYISKLIECDYGVFSNGSHLLNLNELKTLKCSLIKTQAVLELYDYCKKNNLYIHLNQEFCEVSDQMNYFNLKHHLLNKGYPDGLKSECYLVNDLKNYIINNDITKIVIVSENELDSVLYEIRPILEKYGLYITEYNKNLNEHIINRIINYIEIGATMETKASGLLELAKILNIPTDEILVFGDGNNDLEMLSKFNNSVCMSNGSKKAKKIAKYITKKDNNNSGVAEGIIYFMKKD